MACGIFRGAQNLGDSGPGGFSDFTEKYVLIVINVAILEVFLKKYLGVSYRMGLTQQYFAFHQCNIYICIYICGTWYI
jgi:hypothetical protein